MTKYFGLCKKCCTYGELFEGYCIECRERFLTKLKNNRTRKNKLALDKYLNINNNKQYKDVLANHEKIIKKYSHAEQIAKNQSLKFSKDEIGRRLWKSCYSSDFPDFDKYKRMMKRWNIDISNKLDVDNKMDELDCILSFEKGKNIFQVLKEFDEDKNKV